MVSNLYPTPTRVELARSIAAGNVLEYWAAGEIGQIEEKAMGRWWKVTGKVELMRSAGLCETHPDDVFMNARRTALTEAGEQWLAEHDREAGR